MKEMYLDVQEINNGNEDAMIAMTLVRDDQVIYRQTAKVFSGEEIIAASNEVARLGNLNRQEVDQALASQAGGSASSSGLTVCSVTWASSST